jgi:hypothetical protein
LLHDVASMHSELIWLRQLDRNAMDSVQKTLDTGGFKINQVFPPKIAHKYSRILQISLLTIIFRDEQWSLKDPEMSEQRLWRAPRNLSRSW